MTRWNQRSPLRAIWMAILFASAAFAQPQSPNFHMVSDMFCAGGKPDSSTNFRLVSAIGQWSAADTNTSPNFRLTGGFFVPSFGTCTGAFLVVNPARLNFGSVHVDSTRILTITVSDTGYWNLQLTGMQMRSGALFEFVPPPELPDTIFARGSRQYDIRFHPVAAGLCQDTLSMTHDAGSPVFIPMEGIGTAPVIMVDPDTIAFGERWIGRAVEDTFTVTNSGSADLHVDSISSNHAVFPAVTIPFTVPAGASHPVPFSVTLPETLSYNGLFTLHSNAGMPTILLSAHGIWTELRPSAAAIILDGIQLGDSASANDTLSSIGNTEIGSVSARLTTMRFTVIQAPANLIPAHGWTTVGLRIFPRDTGTVVDTLVITNSIGPELLIPLSVTVRALSVDPQSELIPREFFLHQNFPNPFNPSTQIRFGMPKSAHVTIDIFDILGRKVTTIISGTLRPGVHTVPWDCVACPSGMYLIRMQAEGHVFLRKMLLMK